MQDTQKIAILKKLITFASVNDNEAAVAAYIKSLFAGLPHVTCETVAYAPRRDNLVITIGNTGPLLGFSGHMDVVAPGKESDWSTPPFQPVIKTGRLYGRGAADMKSGLAALVVALLELAEDSTQLNGRIRLLATVGEETGEYGAAQLTAAGYADHLAGLLIAEPTDNMQEIVYTARGVIDYRVTSNGKAAHSARPEDGVNAIDNLLTFYRLAKQKLAAFDQTDPILGKNTHSITKITGGEQVNSVPSYAELMGNIRTIPQYPNQVFFAALEQIVAALNQQPGYDLTLSYSFPEEAIPGDPHSNLVQLAQQVYQKHWDHPAKVAGELGANDGAEFLQARGDFDSIVIGPGANVSHQSNEYVVLETYLKACAFYKDFATTFFSTQQ
ncbi:ArgE/DapE family deacylase [Liquorilactobacillus satsumensis]|uniref:Probable succinyl-diaminopimelate desuccinylase n=1 Tax=Liquorilactobacillus satsumensis DSM 16230 = JCM 12392 TaxID=1423801 RepID=A0A0R1V0B5_9LACO|nr:ArgE/DapE family deacylase [Liquorilactobacillus satsumensis]KRL99049.1 acetylornithine deacetylase succinyl-diaminopimelate desuccinylase-like protein [Liquorilactobacillus satsumensis DSM 16230 = JCM 12392]